MKLGEVQVKENVPDGSGPGSTTQRLLATRGWDMSLEAGVITARKENTEMLIPLSNVSFARVLPPEPKPVKKAEPKVA